jgi:hypothetical protein
LRNSIPESRLSGEWFSMATPIGWVLYLAFLFPFAAMIGSMSGV